MYYRNFRPAEKRNENDVPVQYFGDSFSADAFSKKDNVETIEKSCNTNENRIEDTDNSEKCKTNPDKQDNIDSLLLIGLIFLFLTDYHCKEDLIIPVILGIILLS